MLNPEPDHKPIIGDDGELIEPDTLVDDEQYEYYVWGDLPEPDFSTQLRNFVRDNFGIILVSVLVFLAATPFISGLVLKSNPSSRSVSPTSTPIPAPVKTSQPTSNRTLPPLDARYLPSSGNWSDTYSNLPVTRVKWSPDGNTIAYQQGDKTIAFLGLRVYESWINTEQALSYFDWMPDSRGMVGMNHPTTGSLTDPVLSIFESPGSEFNMQPVKPQPDFMPGLLATSPQNVTAVVSSDGSRISIINHNLFRWMATRRLDSPVHDLDWIGDGSWYSLVTDTGIWKWLPGGDIPFEVLRGQYQQVSWSPNGKDIVVTQKVTVDSQTSIVLSRIHPIDAQIKWTQTLPRPVQSSNAFNPQVDWSPDGQRIATFIRGESAIDLWGSQTGKPVLHFNSRSPINAIDWSPDGSYLAIGTDIGLTLWSVE